MWRIKWLIFTAILGILSVLERVVYLVTRHEVKR